MKQKACFHIVADGKEITFKEALFQIVFVSIMYAIGYSCFLVAILNLLFVRPLPLGSLLASLAWITIIVVTFVSGCRKTGIRQHLVNILGNFVRNRFAIFMSDDSGESLLCFGYPFASQRHYFLKVRSKGTFSVDWGEGQGNRPEKDNDWYVAMWFDAEAIVFDGQFDEDRGRLPVYIVASGHKAIQESFGNGFIEFLVANQVHLKLPPRDLLGQVAEVVEPLAPLGKIKIGSEEYAAKPLERMLDRGCRVVIDEIRGTSVYVRPSSIPNQASQ